MFFVDLYVSFIYLQVSDDSELASQQVLIHEVKTYVSMGISLQEQVAFRMSASVFRTTLHTRVKTGE
jgi:hypothetical protein